MAAILSLPISCNHIEDSVWWVHNRHECYSVESGYWLGMLGAVSMNNNVSTQLWSKVWNIQGPPKLRHFLWRACKGSLPVFQEMYRRHIRNSGVCPRCNKEDETICHALVQCDVSMVVWTSSPFDTMIADAPHSSFADCFLWLHDHMLLDDMSAVCASLWACWMGRNKMVMEKTDYDVRKLAVAMVKMVGEHNEYAKMVFTVPLPNAPRLMSWKPPEDGWVKVNFDAYIGDGCRRGLGIVCL